MKVLLTGPIWSFEDEWGEMTGLAKNRFNFGFACLSGYIKNAGHEVTVIEPTLLSRTQYISFLREANFNLVGITGWTHTVLRTYATAKLVKELSPKSVVVVGGVHVSLLPERTLQECEHIDCIVVGEGERALLALVETLESPKPEFNKVPSLFYREGEEIHYNSRAKLLEPEEFPFPDYVGAGLTKFRSNPPHFKYLPTYELSISRGCPFRCAFCNGNKVHGRKVRYKPVGSVIEELGYLRDELGARGFAFHDSTLTADRRWVEEFTEAYRKAIGLPWRCYSRVDQIDEDLLKAMKSSGCWQIGFGFESANEKTLRSMKKKTSVAQNAEAIRLCRKHNLQVYGSFVIGWPGETYEDAMNTVKWAMKDPPNVCLFNTPDPYPDTQLRELCVEDGGTPSEWDWEVFDSVGAVQRRPLYINPKIGSEKMGRLQRHAYLKYYSSPKALLRRLSGISSWDQAKNLPMEVLVYLRLLQSFIRQRISHRTEN